MTSIKVLEQDLNEPGSQFSVYIDNDTIIKRISNYQSHNNIHPLSPTYEMYEQLQKMINKSDSKGAWRWVKVHQTDSHLHTILNNEADEIENFHRQIPGNPPFISTTQHKNMVRIPKRPHEHHIQSRLPWRIFHTQNSKPHEEEKQLVGQCYSSDRVVIPTQCYNYLHPLSTNPNNKTPERME